MATRRRILELSLIALGFGLPVVFLFAFGVRYETERAATIERLGSFLRDPRVLAAIAAAGEAGEGEHDGRLVEQPLDEAGWTFEWRSIATLRAPSRGASGLDGKGVIITDASGEPAVAVSHFRSPDAARADDGAEATWIAIVRTRRIPNAYFFDNPRQGVAVESAGVRLYVLGDPEPVAMGTVESRPPELTNAPMDVYHVSETSIAELVTEMRIRARTVPRPAPFVDESCPLARMPSGEEPALGSAHPACRHGASDECLHDCFEDGPGESCLEAAYALEEIDEPFATTLYRRACEAGYTIGCTNWASHVEVGPDVPAERVSCRAAMFERACLRDEPYACGMWGLALARGEGVAPDLVRARAALEASCDRVGHFACSIAGMLLADGTYGRVEAAPANAALARACETGYREACDYSVETFAPAATDEGER